jgi:hypothetical protein
MKGEYPLGDWLKWLCIYAATVFGLWYLHHPLDVSMRVGDSTVQFVYQQF